MKKYVKLFSVALLTLLLCMSFCSCKELDELRDSHGVWTNEGRTTISFQGKEYKLLPACKDLSLIPATDNYGVVSKPDVPVLLGRRYGEHMRISQNQEMLVSGHWDDNSGCNKVYCRTDMYDAMVSAISSYELNRFCVYDPVYKPDTDGESYDDVVSLYRVLSEKSCNTIKTALAGEGKQDKDFEYYGTEIYFCDETLRFIAEERDIRIVEEDDGCSIVVQSFNGDVRADKYVRYEVPTEEAKALMTELYDWNNEWLKD